MTETILQTPEYKRLRAIYILMMAGVAACFISSGFIFALGALSITIAAFMAYYGRKRAEDPVYKSHYNWQIRIFWIGNLIAFPIAMVFNALAMYYMTDFGELITNALSGSYGMDTGRIYSDMVRFQDEHVWEILLIKWATYGLAVAWWIHRYAYGYRLLEKHQLIELKK